MNLKRIFLGFFFGLFCTAVSTLFADDATPSSIRPVTPNTSPEAVQLLQYLYSLSGNNTLTGQHAVPLLRSARLVEAQRAGGHPPAIFGMDFGFDSPGTWDGINFRQQIVDEAIQKYRPRDRRL